VARCAIRVDLVNDTWTELRGEIAGPPDTPYEGGTFHLEIIVPETYPFNPPKVMDLILCPLSIVTALHTAHCMNARARPTLFIYS